MHHAFLFISYPSLHDYKVKVLHFTFCRGREHKTTLQFNSKNIASIWRIKRDVISVIKFVGSISTVSRVRSLILPGERRGMSVGAFSRTAAGNRAYKVWGRANSHFKWRFRSRRRCYCLSSLLGTLRSDDGDGNEYVKKAIGLITKTTTLRLHHAFLYMPLPLLHDFDVKMPDFTFYRGSTQETTKFPLCFWTWIWFSGVQL